MAASKKSVEQEPEVREEELSGHIKALPGVGVTSFSCSLPRVMCQICTGGGHPWHRKQNMPRQWGSLSVLGKAKEPRGQGGLCKSKMHGFYF